MMLDCSLPTQRSQLCFMSTWRIYLLWDIQAHEVFIITKGSDVTAPQGNIINSNVTIVCCSARTNKHKPGVINQNKVGMIPMSNILYLLCFIASTNSQSYVNGFSPVCVTLQRRHC